MIELAEATTIVNQISDSPRKISVVSLSIRAEKHTRDNQEFLDHIPEVLS